MSAAETECPQTFKSVRKLSKVFINSEFLETLQSDQKLCRVPTNFPEYMETFQRVRKNFIVPVTFQSVWKLSRVSKILSKV